jgi:hypothetical protein
LRRLGSARGFCGSRAGLKFCVDAPLGFAGGGLESLNHHRRHHNQGTKPLIGVIAGAGTAHGKEKDMKERMPMLISHGGHSTCTLCLSAWLAVALLGVTSSGPWQKAVATEQSHSCELLPSHFTVFLLTRSSDDLLLSAELHREPSKVVRSIASHGTR